MKPGPVPPHRYRAILDFFLIILVILLLAVNGLQAQAGEDRSLSTNQDGAGSYSSILAYPGPANQEIVGAGPPSNLVVLDNLTLAAMIAAENAALTAPQYIIALPMVRR